MAEVHIVWEWHGGEPEIVKIFHSEQKADDFASELSKKNRERQASKNPHCIFFGNDFYVEEIEVE